MSRGKPRSQPGAATRSRVHTATTTPVTAGQGHAANARRIRTATEAPSSRSSFGYRSRVGSIVIFSALTLAAAQLFNLQVPSAEGLRAQAANQLKVTDVDPAVRGAIVDRNFDKLAFTMEARALTFQPAKVRKQLAEARQKAPSAPDPDQRLAEIGRAHV